jgi:hypothetical protein
MGSALDYRCTNCGYSAKFVTEAFDYGMNGEVTTPVVCPTHGIKQAETRINAFYDGWEHQLHTDYPCPRCRRKSPLWDRVTCPRCGAPTLTPDPDGPQIMWD